MQQKGEGCDGELCTGIQGDASKVEHFLCSNSACATRGVVRFFVVQLRRTVGVV